MLSLCVCITGFLAAVVGSVPTPDAGVNTPTEQFNKSEVLDVNKGNKYKLFWKFNDTHITFEVHVKTTGFVGFGISDNGGMYPGDVVVGWVKNGSVHFKDYHTVAKAVPKLDKSQDWQLLHGEESNGETIIKFVRKLDTCDTAGDKVIKEGRVHVIYSYNDQDPANDSALFYHGPATRGTKELSLLSDNEQILDLPADIRRLEFLQRNFIVPNASTTYNCLGFQLPNLGGKHHMIQYEPVITPGNENMIHHLILYRCKGINASMDGVQGNCYARDRPLPRCFNMVVAWVVGGRPFYFPSNVGFSVGATNDAPFYILETHYDNPSNKSGVIDSSGILVTITKNLRTHDAGILLLGHDITLEPIAPPHVKDFLVKGYCPSDCFSRGMKAVNISEINIFAALQHSHLLGRAIKTRHFRNGTELPTLMDEPHYDFNFQELTMLPKQRVVKPGDSISVECIYDTTGKSREVFSGWGTDEEMCNTFLYYYPWMESQFCLSRSLDDSFPVSSKDRQQFMNYLRGLDWRDPAVVANFQRMHFNSTVDHQCMGATLGSFSNVNFVEREPANPYQAPANTCDVPIDPIIIG